MTNIKWRVSVVLSDGNDVYATISRIGGASEGRGSIVERVRPGVAGQEAESIAESALQLGLQGIVVRRTVVSGVRETTEVWEWQKRIDEISFGVRITTERVRRQRQRTVGIGEGFQMARHRACIRDRPYQIGAKAVLGGEIKLLTVRRFGY